MEQLNFSHFRQKDFLRCTKDEFQRKENDGKPKKSCDQKSIFVRKSNSTMRNEQLQINLKEQLKLKAEYLQIQTEIQQLNIEIEPLRDKCRQLIQEQEGCLIGVRPYKPIVYKADKAFEININDFAPKLHVSAVDYFNLKQQSDNLRDELIRIQKEYGKITISKMKKEIEKSYEDILNLYSICDDYKVQEESIRLEIKNHKLSNSYIEQKKQNRKYKHVYKTLKIAVEKHRKLKKAYKYLSEDHRLKSAKQLSEYRVLQERLSEADIKLMNIKREYIRLKDKQIEECKAIENSIAIRETKAKDTVPIVPESWLSIVESDLFTSSDDQYIDSFHFQEYPRPMVNILEQDDYKIFVGYWSSYKSRNEITNLFQFCGEIKKIQIFQNGEKGFCAIIEFSILDWSIADIKKYYMNLHVEDYSYIQFNFQSRQNPNYRRNISIQGSVMDVVEIEPEEEYYPNAHKIPENINEPQPKHKGNVDIEKLLDSSSSEEEFKSHDVDNSTKNIKSPANNAFSEVSNTQNNVNKTSQDNSDYIRMDDDNMDSFTPEEPKFKEISVQKDTTSFSNENSISFSQSFISNNFKTNIDISSSLLTSFIEPQNDKFTNNSSISLSTSILSVESNQEINSSSYLSNPTPHFRLLNSQQDFNEPNEINNNLIGKNEHHKFESLNLPPNRNFSSTCSPPINLKYNSFTNYDIKTSSTSIEYESEPENSMKQKNIYNANVTPSNMKSFSPRPSFFSLDKKNFEPLSISNIFPHPTISKDSINNSNSKTKKIIQ